jgi:hypothetical protein
VEFRVVLAEKVHRRYVFEGYCPLVAGVVVQVTNTFFLVEGKVLALSIQKYRFWLICSNLFDLIAIFEVAIPGTGKPCPGRLSRHIIE